MASQPTVIYSAANTQQAYLLRGLLEEQGIAASVVNDALQVAGGELPLGWTTAPRVVVAESDAAQARALAEQFDQQTAHEPTLDSASDADGLVDWPDWPRCPRCSERRSARCGVCGASRTDFLLADMGESDDSEEVLLKCDDCDDLFRPQWYRCCAACGYDFGGGLAVGCDGTDETAPREKLVIVALAIATAAIALVIYFFWLFATSG